jgi:hypothetical protein
MAQLKISAAIEPSSSNPTDGSSNPIAGTSNAADDDWNNPIVGTSNAGKPLPISYDESKKLYQCGKCSFNSSLYAIMTNHISRGCIEQRGISFLIP